MARFQTGALTIAQCALIAQALKTQMNTKAPLNLTTEEVVKHWQAVDELHNLFNKPELNMIRLDDEGDDTAVVINLGTIDGAADTLSGPAPMIPDEDLLAKRTLDMTGEELIELVQHSTFVGNIMTMNILLELVLAKNPTLIPGLHAEELNDKVMAAAADFMRY